MSRTKFFLRTAGLAAVFSVLYIIERRNYLLFHSLVEITSVAVAAAVFMFAWVVRDKTENDYFLFLGIGLLFVGIVDIAHTLSYSGMGIIQEGGANLPTQLWLIGRYLLAFTLIGALFFTSRKFNPVSVVALYIFLTGSLLLSVFYWNIFPAAYIEGRGLTGFKIASEYAVSALLIASLFILSRKKSSFRANVARLLQAAIIVLVFSELIFTFYRSPFGLFNMTGHLLKFTAYYLLFTAIVETGIRRPFDVLFREVQDKEKLLSAERDRLLKIMDSMGDGVYIVSPENVIEYVNPAMEKEFGLVGGRKCFEYCYGREEPCPWCRNDEVFRGGEAHWEFIAPDKNKVYELMETRIDNPDGTFSKLKVFHDITERKRKEEELANEKNAKEKIIEQKDVEIKQSQKKLEHAKRLADIGTLSATIAHELRNPLATVRSAIYNMKRKNRNSNLNAHIARIEKKIKEADQIISNLLYYSRLKKADFKELKISDFIQEIIENSRKIYPDVSIRFLKGKEAPEIEADPVQLRELFENLLNNAAQAVPDKSGKITVRTALTPGRSLEISIGDNGPGIPADVAGKVFAPFFTTKSRGTGLGLTVCRQIVELHGGTISVDSRSGEGTSATVTLPLRQHLPV